MAARSGGTAPRIPFHAQLSKSVYQVRRKVARIDNAEIRKARGLARVSRSGKLDVLYLGDSATSFVAPYDSDRRRLYRMVQDLLGESVATHVVHGGSYHPPLFDGFLRLVTVARSRPVIIVPLCIRVRTLPWIEHPIFGLREATQYLSTIDPATPWWKIRAGFAPPKTEAFARFHRLPHFTWAGELSIGDYVDRLKRASAKDDDWVKLLYAYHHGGHVQGGAHLDAITGLGERLRQLDAQVVVYQTPVPVQKGVELHGPDFRHLAQRNFATLDAAFVAGYGLGAQVLQTGLSAPTEEFIDWRDGSEHLNQHGRLRLAAEIANAVSGHLRRPVEKLP